MKKSITVFFITLFYSALLAAVLVGFFSGQFGGRGIKSKLAANAPFIAIVVPLGIWWTINYFRKKSKKKSVDIDVAD